MTKTGLFDIFKRRDPRQNHDPTPDEQLSGGETMATKGEYNRLKIQLAKQKLQLEHERDMLQIRAQIEEAHQDLEDLQAEDEPEEGGSTDQALLTLVSSFLAKKNGEIAPQGQPAATIEATPEGEPTNEELRQLWHKLPDNYKSQALGMIKK